jgi:hypothetical protein
MAAQAIRAELSGDDTAAAEGLTAKTNAGPALALCRKLIDAGFDAQRPLHCYRGDRLCLKVTSIGWGAKHTGVGMVDRRSRPSQLQAVSSGGGALAR